MVLPRSRTGEVREQLAEEIQGLGDWNGIAHFP